MDLSKTARKKEPENEKRRQKKLYMDEKLKAEIVSKAFAELDGAISVARYGQRIAGR